MTRRSRNIALVSAAIVLTALATAGTAYAWLVNPVTPVAHEVRELFWKAFGVTMFFFIIAELILLVAVLRFRARPGVPAATWHENFKLEIVWTAIPAIAMVVLSGPSFTTLKNLETVP
ncbi:MAG: cytochrome c oxidase subunit II transmembrane domain-containing protein, partial [Candidatus Eiseniibacteriota bacterium]